MNKDQKFITILKEEMEHRYTSTLVTFDGLVDLCEYEGFIDLRKGFSFPGGYYTVPTEEHMEECQKLIDGITAGYLGADYHGVKIIPVSNDDAAYYAKLDAEMAALKQLQKDFLNLRSK